MRNAVLASVTLVPLAILLGAVWVVERRLRPNAIAPSRRLLVYLFACLLASVGPAWLVAETYVVIMAKRDAANPGTGRVPGVGEAWFMLTVGLTSITTLAFGFFDRARSVYLYRQHLRREDPFAMRTGGDPSSW